MKVLHVLQSDRFSGAENVVCQMIKMFDRDKDIQMVYCSRDGQIRGEVEKQGICFVPIKELSVSELKRVIQSEKPDLIHAHDMRAGFITACSCGSIPFVSHIHVNALDSQGLSAKAIAYRFAARKAKHIFWVSDSAFESYRFHNSLREKSSVLYNVIDIEALYRKMDTDRQSYDYDIVYLGRLTAQKNPQRLIRVLKQALELKPDLKIAVIGTGELEAETKQLASDLRMNDKVTFLGFQTNPLKILHDAKVMIMTSQWEGTPMCSLEAMALGVPIVATPVDGLKNVVINGETGVLSDDDSKLAAELVRIASDPHIHDSMSDKAKALSKKMNDLETYRSAILKGYGIEK